MSHKKPEVYKISLKLMEEVYEATKSFPKVELYIIISQIRRAAISACSNIAEKFSGGNRYSI
ncbi:MAG: four helix bundle protein [Bacteroidota bacterium]